MTARSRSIEDVYRRATPEDVRRVFGDVEDQTIAEILSAGPTYRDLNDAALWVRGDGDLIAREHRELSAGALAIAELMSRAEEDVMDERD